MSRSCSEESSRSFRLCLRSRVKKLKGGLWPIIFELTSLEKPNFSAESDAVGVGRTEPVWDSEVDGSEICLVRRQVIKALIRPCFYVKNTKCG